MREAVIESRAAEAVTMKNPLRPGSVLTVLTAAAAMLLTACAENESTLFIQGCLVPDSDSCTVDPSGESLLSPKGFLDVSVNGGGSYSCFLLLGNQLVPVGDDITLRTETSRIVVHDFDVEITNTATGAAVGAGFRAPANGLIDPTSGPSPGYGAVEALLVDADTAASVATNGAELLVSVVALGRTLGGTEITSAPWRFTVGVCDGCTCAGQNPVCQFPDDSLVPNCRAGFDGQCRYVETDCP